MLFAEFLTSENWPHVAQTLGLAGIAAWVAIRTRQLAHAARAEKVRCDGLAARLKVIDDEMHPKKTARKRPAKKKPRRPKPRR